MNSSATKKQRGERGKEKIKNPDNLEILRERLREKTQSSKYSDLEKTIGVSDSSILSIVNGDRNNVKIDNLISIAKGLGVSIDYLVGLSDFSEIDVALKDISKKTGLSLNALDVLMYDKRLYQSIDALNELISSFGFSLFVKSFKEYLEYSKYLIEDLSSNKYHLTPKGIELALLNQCMNNLQTLREYSFTQNKLNIEALKVIEKKTNNTNEEDLYLNNYEYGELVDMIEASKTVNSLNKEDLIKQKKKALEEKHGKK